MTAGVVSDERGERGRFMVGAMFGKPTRMSEAREELRDGNVAEAVSGALDAMRDTKASEPFRFASADGEYQGRTLELLNVTCPFMDAQARDPEAFNIDLFEAVTGGAALALSLSALLGDLRQSGRVESFGAGHFRLRADRPIHGLLDGEPHDFQGEVRVELDTQSGLVMAPWPTLFAPIHRPAGAAA